MQIKKIKENLESAVQEVIKAFEKKQDLYFEFFVGDDCTGIACFSNEYYINLTDICHDVFTNQPKGLIIEWQENSIEYQEKKGYINYDHYCMGARYSDLKQKKLIQIEVNKETIKKGDAQKLMCEARDFLENESTN